MTLATAGAVVVGPAPELQASMVPVDTGGVAGASNVAVHPAGPGAVRVTWSATSQHGVVAWAVQVIDSDRGQITSHDRLAPPGRRSLLVDGLPTGSTATATVQSFTGATVANLSPGQSAVQVPSGLCTGAGQACVSVDARRRLGRERHIAQGLLHGLDVTQQGDRRVRALEPRFWRISAGNQTESQQVQRFHADTTALLSDAWSTATHNPQTGTTLSPWQDWSAYRSFIVHQVRARIRDRDLPNYWEVQNEPDIASYYNPAAPPTAALVLQQFRVAYRAIHRVLPRARVIGPSLSAYALVGNAQRIGLADFINYATRYKLRFSAISWHEVNAGNPSDSQRQLPGLVDRVQTVRTLLSASRVLRRAHVFVNEFDSAWVSRQVGWDLGHVAALEQAGVAQANRACFELCSSGADSLLDPNDGTTPRMTYWGRLAYARMTGERIGTTSSDRDTTAMASIGGRALTVIVTRHNECALHTPSACPAIHDLPVAGSGPLTIRVRMPTRASGVVTAAVTQLSATPADVPRAPATSRTRYRVGTDHIVRVWLPDITNGAATVLRLSWN